MDDGWKNEYSKSEHLSRDYVHVDLFTYVTEEIESLTRNVQILLYKIYDLWIINWLKTNKYKHLHIKNFFFLLSS